MTAEKRKRSVNFSTEEKMKFLRILKKKGQVIITKVTSHDLQTNRLKEEAWTEVTDELNASGSILRTKDNLKKLWQKMKTEAKTYTQTNGTSGGPTRMDDPVLEVVADLTGYGSSVGGSTYSEVESVYDCEPEIVFSGIKQEKSNPKRRWPTLCDDEQSNKSAKVSTPSNNNFANERLKCEKEKSALIELQKQHMTEEHALKIKHGELKTKILEAVLKKVQDEKPVDSELLKIVSNM